MILISLNGEQLLVDSLDGHDGATVIADNIDPPTDPAAVWDGAAFTVPLDVLKARKKGEVDLHLYELFQGGFTPSSGPLTGHVLQTRDDTDRTNWLTSQAAYRAAIDQGAGAVSGASFRTADNLTITCTYQEGFDALMAMADWGKTIMGKSWTLKDQITAITSSADVEAYDVNAQWAALP
jgi:hypothetical protein